MKIFFDGYELDRRYVKALSQSAEAFNGTFKLGSTICRAFELEISKECTLLELLQCEDGLPLLTEDGLPLRVEQGMDITTYRPQKIRLTDDMEKVYATLRLDDIDTEDDYILSYKLTDEMVMLNQEFVYDTSQTHTVQELLNMICTSHGMKLATTSLYLADMPISWGGENMTERDFVSYVAEVNCGYAFINKDGNLEFKSYTNTPSAEIDVRNCSSFKVGYHHIYDRVYLELGTATYYYPETSDHDTLYLNPENILFTSGGKYPYTTVMAHMYNQIKGFNFYNIEANRCPIPDTLCCETVEFNLSGTKYPTLWQVAYDYNTHWYGGLSCILEGSEQEETKIKNPVDKVNKKVNYLKIIVDRELGLIKQDVSATEEKVNKISSDAIFTVDIMYALSSSNTEAPTTGWSTEAPKPKDGEFIWQKTMTVYGDGSIVESTPTCLQGLNGKDGADGKDGINGVNGKDGVSNYIFIRYSANADGSNMTASPNENTKYIGTVTALINVAPTDYTEYSWTLIKGADGKNGENGIPGTNGIDGKTSYLHIKYSNDGSTFTANNGEELGTWIGTYVDFNEKDSSVFEDYVWKRFVGTDGADGKNGIDGINGKDGTSYYVFIRYSQYSNGSAMSVTPNENTKYMGIAQTTINSAPTSASDYTWSLIKGSDGTNGTPGVDGSSSYLHIKYSNDGKTFTSNYGEELGSWIGTLVDDNLADSTTFSDYTWKKYVGENGKDGINGTNGKDGTNAYFFVRYSANADGSGMTIEPTSNTKYMGVATNTVNSAPTSASSYKWSLIKGADGTDGIPGTDGSSSYIHIKYSNDGSTFTANNGEELGTWIGTLVDENVKDSTVFSDYTWKKFVGEDGKDGINGVNGTSAYIFIRYSANANGSGMTTVPNTNTKYLGVAYSNVNSAPSSYTSYTWTLIKGADGEKGIPGEKGTDGKTSYLHIKYSNDGKTFTANNGETIGTWIGTYVDFNETDSTSFNAYTWKKYVGSDGANGKDGADGVGIKSIEEQYYLSTSKTELSGGSWQTTCPSWQKGKYIWSRSKITWTDNTVSYTTPTVSSAINDANEKADNTYQTLITYYSTTEQTDSKISQSVTATKTDILGQVSKTYATKASLEIYVTEDKAKNSIASWINACADNIVLNASSKLVFGDLNNQYITISNYSDSSGNKVGVLFDGTGQIMFTPSGAFDVRNIVSGTLKNQFQISALGVSNNVSIWNNQKNNESYYANSVTMGSQLQADGSYNNSINLYNYIVGSNKEANYISMSNDGSSKYLKINNDGTMNRIWFTRTGNNTHIQLANFSTNSGSDIYTNVLEFDSSKGITMLNKDYGYPGNFPRNLVTGFSMRYVDFNINSLDDLRLTASGLLYLNSSDDYVTKIWYNGAKLKKAITISADQIFIKGEGGCYRIVGMTNKCLAVEPVPEGNQSESSGGKYRCQRVYYKEWA